MFKGKNISGMTREELLDFATWAGKELDRLNQIERSTRDFRIEKEVSELLTNK